MLTQGFKDDLRGKLAADTEVTGVVTFRDPKLSQMQTYEASREAVESEKPLRDRFADIPGGRVNNLDAIETTIVVAPATAWRDFLARYMWLFDVESVEIKENTVVASTQEDGA